MDITGDAKQPIKWKRYLELCKPNVVLLMLFTSAVGMLLATDGNIPWFELVVANFGIALSSGAAAAINHYVDRHIDVEMGRTDSRPLPQGEIKPINAIIFAIILATVGLSILFFLINPLTSLLTFIGLLGYAVFYTMYLKRNTPHNIVIGGAAGAAPPLLGWVAVTGEINTEALLLFLIIFIWTPPHFWALAIKRRVEYAKTGVPMLPVTHGVEFTKLHILLYTLMLLAVTLLPFIIHMSGIIYLSGAIALGIGFIISAYKLYRDDGDRLAMKTFVYSIKYLTALFGFLLADHYARLFFRGLM
ncbi:MAG: protoheme IX farnesyltransferase [Gammaproteobacteria bacterium]|nr:protoheme IX farnesyltransferase [Gammaproteobacteria bacterium]